MSRITGSLLFTTSRPLTVLLYPEITIVNPYNFCSTECSTISAASIVAFK